MQYATYILMDVWLYVGMYAETYEQVLALLCLLFWP